MISCPSMATVNAFVAVFVICLAGSSADAQALKVIPVNVQMPPGQRTATLTVINEGNTETAIQIRTYAWNQANGNDELTNSNEVLASPPLTTIAPGATQIVRLVLRRTPEGREATYRVLLDQIPPPAVPGEVKIVLRMSIPIFAQPANRTNSHVQFHIERDAGQIYLVGINNGLRHEAIRDIVLSTKDGRKLKTASGAAPYILAGVTRRWLIAEQGSQPLANETLRMTARADAGAIEQQVRVVEAP
jgi:fimbrial chaperone protein